MSNAALNYDKKFRLWRQDSPEQLPCDQLYTKLFKQALVMGLTSQAKGSSDKRKDQEKRNNIVFASTTTMVAYLWFTGAINE